MAIRTVLITGASRGIGKAIVERFRAAGHQVLCPTRMEIDLCRPETIERYLSTNANNGVDVLVNNAGENVVAEIASVSLPDFERSLRINLSSPLLLIKAVSPHMVTQEWGRIVNISSCYSIVSREGRVSYAAAKAGINAVTRTAALELACHNVLVNSICPGFVETDLTKQNNTAAQISTLRASIPLGRLAEPREVAEFAFFLGSETNTYITGQSLAIDGGFLCR